MKKSDCKTWNEYIKEFSENTDVKETTIGGYIRGIKDFTKYHYNVSSFDEVMNKPFEMFTREDFEKARECMIEDDVSASKINSSHSALTKFGEYLQRYGYESPNLQGLRYSKVEVEEKEDQYFHITEIYDIANSAESSLDNACIRMCFEGALERRFLCKIKETDFDFKKKMLRVYNYDTKSIERYCYFSDETIDIILKAFSEMHKLMDRINENKLKANQEITRIQPFLFQTDSVIEPEYSSVNRSIKRTAEKYCDKLGIQNEERRNMMGRITASNIISSRRIYLFSLCSDVYKVMAETGGTNYKTVSRYKKYALMYYPETRITR